MTANQSTQLGGYVLEIWYVKPGFTDRWEERYPIPLVLSPDELRRAWKRICKLRLHWLKAYRKRLTKLGPCRARITLDRPPVNLQHPVELD